MVARCSGSVGSERVSGRESPLWVVDYCEDSGFSFGFWCRLFWGVRPELKSIELEGMGPSEMRMEKR